MRSGKWGAAIDDEAFVRLTARHLGRGLTQMKIIRRIGAIACAAAILASVPVDACTRFIYRTGTDTFIVGRSMDWAEDPGTDIWSFPRAMERDGGVGEGAPSSGRPNTGR